jgi:hypothetical protein
MCVLTLSWSEEDIHKAIKKTALRSLNAAVLKYNIPYAMMYRYVKKRAAKKLGRFKTVFNKKQETQIVENLQFIDSLFYGLTRREFKKLAYFTEKNRIPRRFENGGSGYESLKIFIRRHPSVSLRSPERHLPDKLSKTGSFLHSPLATYRKAQN